jgi:hypothetical protein
VSAVNDAEAFVHDLCRRSFLSVWSAENPVGPKQGKELADALVVVGDDLVLISVKDRRITPSGDTDTDAARWYRYAVEGSVKQLRGAHRALDRMHAVARRDNPEVRLPLPPAGERRVHFVAVALGGEDLVPAVPEQHDFGLVHVFDRATFEVLLRELDTITDFLDYLRAKEEFLGRAHVVLDGGEWDLLAVYLRDGRTFPNGADALFLTDGLWQQVVSDPAWQRRKAADEISYAWDHLVEEFAGHLRGGTLLGDASSTQVEAGLRYMARERRFHRRLLGEGFVGFMRKAAAKQAQSRVVSSPSGVVYVFIAVPRTVSTDTRGALLSFYCAILRERHPDARAVVGVLTERPDGDWRHSFGLAVIDTPLTDELRALAEEGRGLGLLARQVEHGATIHEYPHGEE